MCQSLEWLKVVDTLLREVARSLLYQGVHRGLTHEMPKLQQGVGRFCAKAMLAVQPCQREMSPV